MSVASERIPEIDVLKGVAILSVFVIHADPIPGTLLFTFVINRAVPIFLVLFGYTSSLWWMKHADLSRLARVSSWFRSRAVRLLIPVWATVLLWWGLQVVIPPPPSLADHVRLLVSLLGYMPWIGTGWFITLILELVVLFPLLLYGSRRLGLVGALIAAGLVTALSYRYTFQVIHGMRILLLDSAPYAGFGGFFYFWIFPPAHLWRVVGGIVLAGSGFRSSRGWLVGAVVAWLGLVLASSACPPPSISRVALVAFADLPLTIVLLAAARAGARLWPAAAAFLAWFGLHSWGLFLGQMLVHNAIQSDIVRALWTARSTRVLSAARFLLLWGGATILVEIGNRLHDLFKLDTLENKIIPPRIDLRL